MRIVHSILHPDDLARLVEREYDVAAPLTAKLLRRGFNDTYLLTDADGGRRILRVYSRDKYWIRSAGDLVFELELLDYLASSGHRVSHPYRLRSGGWLTTVAAPEGDRGVALFTYAEGAPVRDGAPDLDGQRQLGLQIARLHVAMTGFGSQHNRYHLDFEILVDSPLRELGRYVDAQADSYVELCALGKRFKDYVAALDLPADGYGLIHADLNGGNIHLSPSGDATIFDFDHCGYGWRAYDLTSFYRGADATEEQRVRALAFFEGYESVRPLAEAEKASLPVFAACRELWDTGDMLRSATWYGDAWAGETVCERTLSHVKEALKPFGW